MKVKVTTLLFAPHKKTADRFMREHPELECHYMHEPAAVEGWLVHDEPVAVVFLPRYWEHPAFEGMKQAYRRTNLL